jgi:DNA-binding response OmpR family regulator
MDWMLPDMECTDALNEIRRHWGEVPVIVYTGCAEDQVMRRARESLGFTLLTKPSPGQELSGAVRGLMKEHQVSCRK